MPALKRRERRPYSDDTLKSIQNFVVRKTSGMKEGGLRCDFRRNLSEDETAELVALTYEAEDGGGFVLDRLTKKKQERWERLVGKGGGSPDFFANHRASEEIKSLAAQAHRAAVRRPTRRQEETGVFEALAENMLRDRFLDAPHVAVLCLVLTALVSGHPFARSRVESIDGDPILVVDSNFCFFGGAYDPDGQLSPRWKYDLEHLALNDWLIVTKRGHEWTLGIGPRLRAALGGLPVTNKVVQA